MVAACMGGPFASAHDDDPAAYAPVSIEANGSNELRKRVTETKGTTEFRQWLRDEKPAWTEYSFKTGRKCKEDFWCSFLKIKFRKVDVRIQATKEAYKLDLKKVPEKGALVAKVVVEEDNGTREAKYGLRLRSIYFLVVEPGKVQSDTSRIPTAVWYLAEFSGDTTQSANEPIRGTFRHCPLDTSKHDQSDAAFTKCDDGADRVPSHVKVARILNELRVLETQLIQLRSQGADISATEVEIRRKKTELGKELVDESTGPMWVSCTHGCCIADTDE